MSSDDDNKRLVTVCASCLKASCWRYVFPCDGYRAADVVQKTVAELETMNREHADYYAAREDYPEPTP